MNAQEFYKAKIQEEIDNIEGEPPESLQRIKPFNVLKEMKNCKNEEAKMAFGRRMKSPKRLTEPKDGSPYGDIRYGAFDKFPPSGGGEK